MNTLPILVIDSGATKLRWAINHDFRASIFIGQAPGLHPMLSPAWGWEAVLAGIQDQLPEIDLPYTVYFYGTGCAVEAGREQVAHYFERYFHRPHTLAVSHDLMAAARATCGHRAGLVAILGTGSNAAYFDGEDIAAKRGGLGFILGDEGSGAYLGKQLLAAYFNGLLPGRYAQILEQQHGLTRDGAITALYKGEAPSRYLAQWAPLLLEWKDTEFAQTIIQKAFEAFARLNLLPLAQISGIATVHCIGSVGYYYRDYVVKALSHHGLQLGTLYREPLSALYEYHAAGAE